MIFAGSHISSAGGYCAMARQAEKLGREHVRVLHAQPARRERQSARRGRRRCVLRAGAGAGARKTGRARAVHLQPRGREARSCGSLPVNAMREDLDRLEYTPGHYYNFHPGSHVGQGSDAGVALIAEGLDRVLEPGRSTLVLLETMAGKGSEVGRTFEELRAIIDRVAHPELARRVPRHLPCVGTRATTS